MKRFFLKALVNSPLQWFFQGWTKNRLKVLCYHEVNDAEQFVLQVKWLRLRYAIIGPQQLEAHCYEGEALPERPLLITFDDGDISVYEKGLAIFKNFEIPATLFIITSLIDTDQPYWWEEIRHYAPAHWSVDEKEALIWEIKGLENGARKSKIAKLKEKSDREALQMPQLQSSQLKGLEAAGATIANHTHTHPLLDRCSSEEISADLLKADTFIQQAGYQGRHYFAYPNGNYSAETEAQIDTFGFRLAFLFDHRVNNPHVHPLRISRLSVNSSTSLDRLKLILSGLHPFLLRLKKIFS